jgi:hypothetical protein
LFRRADTSASTALSRDILEARRAAHGEAERARDAARQHYDQALAAAVASGDPADSPAVERAYSAWRDADAKLQRAADALQAAQVAADKADKDRAAKAEQARIDARNKLLADHAACAARLGSALAVVARVAVEYQATKNKAWAALTGGERRALEIAGCIGDVRDPVQVELECLGVIDGVSHPANHLRPPPSIADRAAAWGEVLSRRDTP